MYNRYAGKMLSLCFRYAKDRMEAEDILQEGFIRVFDYLHQYQFKGSFEGWMRRIMVTTAINHFRKHHRNHTDVDIEEAEGSVATSFDQYDHKFELKELMDMVTKLPPQYRAVFNLYAIDGYSHREIGEMLGISEGGSKSNLSRARAMLQKNLKAKEQYRYGTVEPNR
jgi:RNA polymerase sigma-70 factor (ECF subfamily)